MVIDKTDFSLSELGISEVEWQKTPLTVQKALIMLHQRLHQSENNGTNSHTSSDLQGTMNFAVSYTNEAIVATEYDYAQLADIYNEARVDYIVPMPMNAKRMREYCLAYDVDLVSSIIAADHEDKGVNGICMLGVRDERTWITRLGIIPHRRRRHAGQFLMLSEIEKSVQMGKKLMQLEVIKGNEPAHRLFSKLGFVETRELLVIRRAPGEVAPKLIPEMTVQEIPETEIFDYLAHREAGAAWTEETISLRNAGNITGLSVTLADGEKGWIAFQSSIFQLSHFVLEPNTSRNMRYALIAAVHSKYPLQDTKIENVPVDHPTWPVFRDFGYMESFSRIEMLLDLDKYR